MRKHYTIQFLVKKTIPKNIVDTFLQEESIKKLLVNRMEENSIRFSSLSFTFENIEFYAMFLIVENNTLTKDIELLDSNMMRILPNSYLIGTIPANITQEIAIDTMSTSEALLARICILYTNRKLIIEDERNIYFRGILNLPLNANNWFGLPHYNNSREIDLHSSNSYYYNLINELYALE